ncbi:MAG: geranylgeranylglycerol-phosphate geranylgeranyltransferase [Flavobacteriales bacterium]|nr:geranylgeranylglycerol-phosphate geranylgeranyltransferase [Flavobacteriales bacterium]
MQKISAFLSLIRLQNLFIVALTQYFIRFAFTKTFLPFPALTDLEFFFFVFTTISITAAGYIINDIYDVETDKINKKNKLIVGEIINARTAIIWYFVLNAIALIIGIYLAIIIGKPLYSLLFVYCIFILWRYSKSMKKAFLIGNIHVAILTALVLINTALFDIIPNIHYKGNESGGMILKIILVYTLFSFLLTLIREFIKDMEDITGDKAINAKTLAIEYGIRKTKTVSAGLIIIVIIGIAFWQYFQWQILSTKSPILDGKVFESVLVWGTDKYAAIYTIILQLSLLFFVVKLVSANSKTDFHYLSNFNKIIMLIGICSMLFFTFFYFL